MDDKLELLNRVANTPEVLRACVPGLDRIDMHAFFDEPRNVMLGNEKGLILFMYYTDLGDGGIYEMHWLLTRELRGQKALKAAKLAIGAMFREAGAAAIVGTTPAQNLGARAMNRALGGKPGAMRHDGFNRPCIVYTLTRKDWLAQNPESVT